MALGKYFSKRKFTKTPEPHGAVKHTKSKKLSFVVQEHHASQLHYDFRIELNGVLKSWAVPKGPSMNPHDRHLAIQVEDHPYAYRTFEDVIPEGNYGAGNVIIWDKGTYAPYHDDPDDEATIRKQLAKGHLTFFLFGEKLKGEFALIKMKKGGDNAWLLIKKTDDFATSTDITKNDASVISGKTVDELEGHSGHVNLSIQKYPLVKKPWRVKPMLCTLVDTPFNSDDWLFEMKWDGYRAVASKHGDDLQLYSRNATDFRDHYPPVFEALRSITHDVILDGEIVVVDSDGKPHFEALQNWRKTPTGQLVYYVFDILWCEGRDIRNMPLIERKRLLQSILPTSSVIRYGDHIQGKGEELFKKVSQQHLEGIVAKKRESAYRENNRGEAWLKIKTHLRQEVVIGGYTDPRGSREYLGSLVVGMYKNGKFTYVGHSGGGIPDAQRKSLREQLEKIQQSTSPFINDVDDAAAVHWVKPQLICEMSFSEWTSDGRMRHPVFEGMRVDKQPTAVHREIAKQPEKEVTVQKGKVEFSHLDKVFFPKHGYTKGDIVQYYESVADYILPYLRDRPLSLLRQPNGINGEGFFQKNMEHLPDWVPATDIFSDSHNDTLHWMVGGDLDTLLYAVQLGSIEINPWSSRLKHLDNPDWLVIDLDPEGVTFKDVITVAKEVKKVCDEWQIPALPKTSGKTGIHIFVPLGAKYDFDQAKNLAHLIAIEVNKRTPKLTSLQRMPNKRQHRIYLDFLQNRQGQTLAAPYSLRPTPDASVSMPLHWDEVIATLKPTDFTIKNATKRLAQTGDLWKPVLEKGIDLAKILKNIE